MRDIWTCCWAIPLGGSTTCLYFWKATLTRFQISHNSRAFNQQAPSQSVLKLHVWIWAPCRKISPMPRNKFICQLLPHEPGPIKQAWFPNPRFLEWPSVQRDSPEESPNWKHILIPNFPHSNTFSSLAYNGLIPFLFLWSQSLLRPWAGAIDIWGGPKSWPKKNVVSLDVIFEFFCFLQAGDQIQFLRAGRGQQSTYHWLSWWFVNSFFHCNCPEI